MEHLSILHVENEEAFAKDLVEPLVNVQLRSLRCCKPNEIVAFENASRDAQHLKQKIKELTNDSQPQPRLLLLDVGLAGNDHRKYMLAREADVAGNREACTQHLEDLTGFRILKNIRGHFPNVGADYRVVILSKYNDKLLLEKALSLGAFAFVGKYHRIEEYPEWKQRELDHKKITAGEDKERLFRQSDLARELNLWFRRAQHDLAMQHLKTHVPSMVAEWVEADPTLLDRPLLRLTREAASLLLADLRGSTTLLSAIGAEGGGSLFHDLMNNVFRSAIILIRSTHRGEISAFTGDGFLAAFNVYAEQKDHLKQALRAAFALQEQFRDKTRPLLERIIKRELREPKDRSHVLDILHKEFGLRIGVATTDPRRTVIATIGCDVRKQHSIISEQMNALSRGLSEVGKLERNGKLSSDTVSFITQDLETESETVKNAGFGLKGEPLCSGLRGVENKSYQVFQVTQQFSVAMQRTAPQKR